MQHKHDENKAIVAIINTVNVLLIAFPKYLSIISCLLIFYLFYNAVRKAILHHKWL